MVELGAANDPLSRDRVRRCGAVETAAPRGEVVEAPLVRIERARRARVPAIAPILVGARMEQRVPDVELTEVVEAEHRHVELTVQ